MYHQWSNILRGSLPRNLDLKTVSCLETLVLEYSVHDRAVIKELVREYNPID